MDSGYSSLHLGQFVLREEEVSARGYVSSLKPVELSG